MKTIITPLGFDTTQIVTLINEVKVEKGDRVVIIRPNESTEEKRGDRAYSTTKELLNNISTEITIEKIVLDTRNFQNMILELSNIIETAEDKIVVNLSGGVRSILVALTTAAIFHHDKIDRICNYGRIGNYMREIELPYVKIDLTENENTLLHTVKKQGPITYNELVKELGFSKSTVSRLSNILEDKSLVKINEKGKEKEVEISLTGRLVNLNDYDD